MYIVLSAIIRFLFILWIYKSKLTLFYKSIILFTIGDSIDCGVVDTLITIIKPNYSHCNKFEHQKYDKILDTLTYILLIDWKNPLLIFLLIFRIVGVYKFVKSGNPEYLITYPDFIRETILFNRYKKALPIIWFIKWKMEKYHHGNKIYN